MDEIPARLGDLLGPAARRAGIEDAAGAGRVWNMWRSIVGPDVALHAEPSSLRGRILRIRADSPAWATELGYLRDEIMRRTNEVVGANVVEEVRVWTGPGRIGSSSPSPAARAPGDGPTTDRDATPAEAFDRAFEAWRRRRRGAAEGRAQVRRRSRAESPEDG